MWAWIFFVAFLLWLVFHDRDSHAAKVQDENRREKERLDRQIDRELAHEDREKRRIDRELARKS